MKNYPFNIYIYVIQNDSGIFKIESNNTVITLESLLLLLGVQTDFQAESAPVLSSFMSSGHVIGNGGSGGNGHEEHSQLRAFLDCSAEEHGVRISDALRLEKPQLNCPCVPVF